MEKITQLQIQLNDREQELSESSMKICELTKRNHQLELDIERTKHERDLIHKESEGEKELCSKLEIEIEKLHAEVQEYSEIRQDVSKLHNFFMSNT